MKCDFGVLVVRQRCPATCTWNTSSALQVDQVVSHVDVYIQCQDGCSQSAKRCDRKEGSVSLAAYILFHVVVDFLQRRHGKTVCVAGQRLHGKARWRSWGWTCNLPTLPTGVCICVGLSDDVLSMLKCLAKHFPEEVQRSFLCWHD